MKREDLKALGLTDEQIESVMTEHGKAIAAEVAKTTAAETRATELQTQITQRDADIAKLQKQSGGNTELQTQLDELKTKYAADTEALKKKLQDQRLDAALDAAIHGARGRNPKAIKALIDRNALKLQEDGTLTGLDLEALKKSDAYLFEVETTTEQGTGATGGTGSKQGAISQEVFQQHINDVAWMQANMEAVIKGLADGTLRKG